MANINFPKSDGQVIYADEVNLLKNSSDLKFDAFFHRTGWVPISPVQVLSNPTISVESFDGLNVTVSPANISYFTKYWQNEEGKLGVSYLKTDGTVAEGYIDLSDGSFTEVGSVDPGTFPDYDYGGFTWTLKTHDNKWMVIRERLWSSSDDATYKYVEFYIKILNSDGSEVTSTYVRSSANTKFFSPYQRWPAYIDRASNTIVRFWQSVHEDNDNNKSFSVTVTWDGTNLSTNLNNEIYTYGAILDVHSIFWHGTLRGISYSKCHGTEYRRSYTVAFSTSSGNSYTQRLSSTTTERGPEFRYVLHKGQGIIYANRNDSYFRETEYWIDYLNYDTLTALASGSSGGEYGSQTLKYLVNEKYINVYIESYNSDDDRINFRKFYRVNLDDRSIDLNFDGGYYLTEFGSDSLPHLLKLSDGTEIGAKITFPSSTQLQLITEGNVKVRLTYNLKKAITTPKNIYINGILVEPDEENHVQATFTLDDGSSETSEYPIREMNHINDTITATKINVYVRFVGYSYKYFDTYFNYYPNYSVSYIPYNSTKISVIECPI